MKQKYCECGKTIRNKAAWCEQCAAGKEFHTCWHSKLDRNVRDCKLRRKTALKYFREGKPLPMPECLKCGGSPETMPIEFVRPELTRQQKKQQTRARQRIKDGYVNGREPYGYTRNAVTGKLQANRKEQAVIKKIVELKSSGMRFCEITSELNRLGIPTKTGKTWSYDTVIGIYKRHSENRGRWGIINLDP